jgi:hypothetical protein
MMVMRKMLLALVSLVFGCSVYKIPGNGIQIPNGHFEELIKDEQIKTLKYISSKELFEIELKETSLAKYKTQIEELSKSGKIQQLTEFRLYFAVADYSLTEKWIKQIEQDNNLPTLRITTN